MMKRFIAFGLLAVFGACSDDPNPTPVTTPGGDGGTGSDTGTSGGDTAKFSGQMEGYTSKGPVSDADVEAGGVTGKTNAKGVFDLAVKKDTPFHLTVTKDAFFRLYDQEMKIAVDAELPKLRFVDKAIGNTLLASLKADATKGVVSVGLKATSGCETKAGNFPAGAKVTIEGQPEAKVVYYNGIPDATLTEGQSGQDPVAVIFNATPDAPLTVKVAYDKCTMRAWPVTEGDVTFTGKLVPKAPETLSVYRVFYE